MQNHHARTESVVSAYMNMKVLEQNSQVVNSAVDKLVILKSSLMYLERKLLNLRGPLLQKLHQMVSQNLKIYNAF